MAANDELIIMDRAARQQGLVTRSELLAAGISSRVLDHRVAASRLRPIHRGVYQVGPLQSPRAREMAAVLACGAQARVSHRSAAAIANLIDVVVLEPVHVTVVGGNRSCRSGIIVHRAANLEPADVTKIDGIPITAPARTIVDLASMARPRELEQAVARAIDMHLVTTDRCLRGRLRLAI